MRLTRLFSSALLVLSVFSCGRAPSNDSQIKAQSKFPMNPDVSLTPGDLCKSPTEYRYNEKIPYCERDVSPSLKHDIIETYDERLGYSIESMNRADFKIDHYISLCMGGSNSVKNLWPQHRSVYVLTDPIESMLCELMVMGRVKQAEAVDTIRKVKNDLSLADEVRQNLQRKLH